MSLQNLSNKKLIVGIQKSFANGESLLSDAYTLGKSKKFPRAYTLCQFAIEEFAKVPLLFTVLMKRLKEVEIDYQKYNRTFKDHSMKTKLGINWEISMLEYFEHVTGEDIVDKIITTPNEYYSKIEELNDLKNESLYVCIKNNDFQSPSEIIDEEKYNNIMGIASLRKLMLNKYAKLQEQDIDKLKLALDSSTKDTTGSA